VDFRIIIALAAAALIAVFNIRAQKSGAVAGRPVPIRRADMPRVFMAILVVRWCGVAGFVVVALEAALGLPISN
jgi:hypothetical protein